MPRVRLLKRRSIRLQSWLICSYLNYALQISAISLMRTLVHAEDVGKSADFVESSFSDLGRLDDTTFFEQQIRPLFKEKCVACHGVEIQEANLRLDQPESLLAKDRVPRLVSAHHPNESRLFNLVQGQGEYQMPPDDKLKPQEIAAIADWIRRGAPWPGYDPAEVNEKSRKEGSRFSSTQLEHWSFQRLSNPPLPTSTNNSNKFTNPIDLFVVSRLEKAGLKLSLASDKRTLLRRATFDLIGLPPTEQELAGFLEDTSPTAFDTVVERLLASSRYGERWAQHWLDVVRYAESAGHDGNNAYLNAWHYRDYVIRAFNDDKPYDQFIVEQIAGDLLPETSDAQVTYDRQAAVGFLQVGPKPVVMRDKRQMLLDIADEQVHSIGTAFMGLTFGCARCHDHKFDPITTKDYYALAGIFMSTQIMADAQPDSMWLEKTYFDPRGKRIKLMTVGDSPQPKNLQIHVRGNYRTLGPEAPRGFPEIFVGKQAESITDQSSGRLELAQWIASRDNPLTARVLVNRVWQHHFGRGLVSTAGNFGLQGTEPTHLELLDWLANYFMDSGWSLKSLHRLILSSRAYQQSYTSNPKALAIDPENNLLWRSRIRRLSAEEIRDALLHVSDELDLTMGGTLFTEGYSAIDSSRALNTVHIPDVTTFKPFASKRRSVYLPVIRNSRPEILKLFDANNENESTSTRMETYTPSQSLFMLNSPFVKRQATRVALNALIADGQRIPSASIEDTLIKTIFQTILGKSPSLDEMNRTKKFLREYQESWQANLSTMESYLSNEEFLIHNKNEYRANPNLIFFLQGESRRQPDLKKSVQSLYVPDLAKSPPSSLSIELWLRLDSHKSATVAFAELSGSPYWKIAVEASENNKGAVSNLVTEFYPANAGGRRVCTGLGALFHDQWHHIVICYEKDSRRVYVDGELADSCQVSVDLRAGFSALTIGGSDSGDVLQGDVTELAIYSMALSEVQIRSRYLSFQYANMPISERGLFHALRALCQSLMCSNEFFYVE